MKSNYKPIGDYIQLVDNRNSDLKASTLLGLTVNKEFIPSVANTVGTDMANYKIIKKNQFACSLMQVRRDKKIPVAVLKKFDEAIISQAYPVFEVLNENELLPEYLMMWFSRSEFDREACFYAVGGVRGSLEWDDFCNMQLPVPDIEKQRAIVKEYNTIVNRIKLNEQLNKKLEETAQAIYKQWFVDFGFPDEDGKPYKSSGGEMVWEADLDKELPKAWRNSVVKDFGKVVTGKTPSSNTPDHFGTEMPFVTPGDFNGYHKFATAAERYLSKKGYSFLKNKILPMGSIIVTCIGSAMGKVAVAAGDCITNQQMNSIIPYKKLYTDYLYYYLNSIAAELKGIAVGGSTMPMLSKTDFEKVHIIQPEERVLQLFHDILEPMNNSILNNSLQITCSQKLRDVLLVMSDN